MAQSIGQKFTAASLIRFALPSMIMMGFMSLYTIVDGIFIARFSGSDGLSAINLVYPVCNVLIAVGVMLATGGSAVVSKLLGEGKWKKARQIFTMITVTGTAVSLLLLAVTFLFADQICYLLGSNEVLLPMCRDYLCVMMLFGPACMLQSLYQSFFVTAGKPQLGLVLTVSGGLANMVLDYVLIALCEMGVAGAAVATGIGQLIPALVGTLFFALPDSISGKKDIAFSRFAWEGKVLLQTCVNGSSEMVTQLANAVITVLFNLILMYRKGADGVAAITIILYGQFLFSSLYLGFAIGVAPVFGFRFGAKDFAELSRLYRICRRLIIISGIFITAASLISASFVVGTFVPEGSSTYQLTLRGYLLFSASYLFCGINIFYSGLFTALSDGKHSAVISFARTFGFLITALAALPFLFGIDGIWLAVPAAEFATVFLAVWFGRKKLPFGAAC